MNIESTINDDRVSLGEKLPLDTPFTVLIDVSEVCNLKCKYCFRSWDIKEYGYALKNNLMNFDTLKLAVKQIKEFPQLVKKISLSGHGEPMCNPNLPEMAKFIKEELNATTEIHTNATLLDKKNIDRFASANIDRFIISLQGLSAEKYEEMCGKIIDCELFRDNIQSLYEKSAIENIFVKIIDMALEDNEQEFYDLFGNICHRIYVEKAQKIWVSTSENKSESFLEQNKFSKTLEFQHCCSSSFYTLFITPSGDVYPCIQPLMTLKLGNIEEKSLVEMWNSSQRKDFLLKQLRSGRSNIATCKNCNIAQNTISSNKDSINDHVDEILERLI